MRIAPLLVAVLIVRGVDASPAGVPRVTNVGLTARDTVLDSAARASVVNRLADRLDSLYVNPKRGRDLAGRLRGRFTRGDYNRLSGPSALAEALSRDLAADAHDLHLWVRYFPPAVSGAPMEDLDETWLNHGFPDVRVLDGNVGFVVIRSFSASPEAERAASAAMSLLVDCDALIVDVRNNGGGNTPAMARAASFFFADSVHILNLYWRDTGDTVRVWTHPSPITAGRLAKLPVFILTSGRTFSAAEQFVDALQAFRSATVVGEVTRGGAHSGKGLQDLGFGLKALVPSGESLNPVTRTNWENTGVQPNSRTSAQAAFGVAYSRALSDLFAKATTDARRTRLRRALAVAQRETM